MNSVANSHETLKYLSIAASADTHAPRSACATWITRARTLLAALPTIFVVLLATLALPMTRARGAAIWMAASEWLFQFSAATPKNPTQAGEGWYFDFPADCPTNPSLGYKPCSVNYVVTRYDGALANGKAITMTYEVDISGSPIFNYLINRNNTCGLGSPGTVRLYFQQGGDNFSGIGSYEFYRWFSTPVPLRAGPNTLSAVLDGANWISVYGKRGNDTYAAAGFAAAVAKVAQIGMVFGGGCFAGHGVNVQGSGTARFTVHGYAID